MADHPRETDSEDAGHSHDDFVLLFSRERKRIYAFVYTLVPAVADAEDVFQQASMVLWRRFKEFDTDKDFYKWACGVVYLTVLNYRRSKRRSRLYFNEDLVQQLADERMKRAAGEAERGEALQECVGQLRDADRSLIARFYGDGDSAKRVADEVGKTVQSVYNRLSFIRKRLLKCVQVKIAARGRAEG